MVNVLVSIDRASLSLPALEISGEDDARTLGLASYQEPGMVWRVGYMPEHPDMHGLEPISATLQQGFISFDVLPSASSESVLRSLVAELENALSQFSFTVTTTVGNATPRVWSAHVGAVSPEARSLENLTGTDPLFAVTIPVYPIAS